MRILGIDYGTVRIGLAISDPDGIIASPLPVYIRTDIRSDVEHIARLVRESGVERIVIGLPLNMDGTAGEMADEVAVFADRLRAQLSIPVVTFDERMTSTEAERVLLQANVSRKKRRGIRDSLAAVLILQSYLDFIRNGER
ncbi:Holliday junction resolvase RuvX [Candidatus Acetothermia bacterium]|nr:Holliday junction resolvase RuvX [Candidatus Bipolaricaulota bacterium]RLE37728.1 MAG: Holliday junction resolvase RuvX [Candidatus Acetothermia bacterium]